MAADGTAYMNASSIDTPDMADVSRQNEELRKQNEELRKKIVKQCKRDDRTKPEVLLLLGQQGVGKSSAINTIIKSICGQYIPRARVGKGAAASNTLKLQYFPRCGVDRNDIEDDDEMRDVLDFLPTIYDFAGQGNVNTDVLAEILELVIGGYVPDGTGAETLVKKQKDNPGQMKRIFKQHRDLSRRVTKVIFAVSSLEMSPPKDLIMCLNKVLDKLDTETGQLLYDVDVFVLMTKYDRVRDTGSSEHTKDVTRQTISNADFKQAEQAMATEFSIHGSMQHNCMRWVSYSDEHGNVNPHIDNYALKFIHQMMLPIRQQKPEVPIKPIMTVDQQIYYGMKKYLRDIWRNMSQWQLSIVHIIVVLVLAAVLYFIMTWAKL